MSALDQEQRFSSFNEYLTPRGQRAVGALRARVGDGVAKQFLDKLAYDNGLTNIEAPLLDQLSKAGIKVDDTPGDAASLPPTNAAKVHVVEPNVKPIPSLAPVAKARQEA